jgi:CBS-domain-containing membrane protein
MTSTVKDIMTNVVVAVREQADYKEIVTVMRRRHVSGLPVLDDSDRVIGVVSEADLLLKEAFPDAIDKPGRLPWHRKKLTEAGAVSAAELMTAPAVTITPDTAVQDAARTMHLRRVKRLPVVDEGGRLVGIVSRTDVLSVFDKPDEFILAEIVGGVIAGEFAFDPADFDVLVQSGIVTIAGPAARRNVALSLIDAIRHVGGVVSVRDRLSYAHQDG